MLKFRTWNVVFNLCRRCFELWHGFSMPSKNEIIPYQQKAFFIAPSDLLLKQLPWGGSPTMWAGKTHEKAISRCISEKISLWLDQNGTKKCRFRVACDSYRVLQPYFCLSGSKAVIFWLIRWMERLSKTRSPLHPSRRAAETWLWLTSSSTHLRTRGQSSNIARAKTPWKRGERKERTTFSCKKMTL